MTDLFKEFHAVKKSKKNIRKYGGNDPAFLAAWAKAVKDSTPKFGKEPTKRQYVKWTQGRGLAYRAK